MGDQVYISAVCLIFSAHAFAEATRLTATSLGVVSRWADTPSFGVGIFSALSLNVRPSEFPSFAMICGLGEVGAIWHYSSLIFEELVKTPGISKDHGLQHVLEIILQTFEDMKLPSVHQRLSGAIAGGTFTWIPTTALSLLLNISARLGWTRFVLIQTSKKFLGLICDLG